MEYGYQNFENPPDQTTGSLEFTKAEWKADNSRIEADGKGVTGQIVIIYNAGSGSQLGAVSVDNEGKWRFRQENPSSIPLRLKASSGSQTVFRDVANAPEPVEPEPPVGDDRFELKKAEWRADRREFKVEGEGTPGNDVEIYNATTDNKIRKVTVKLDGKWKFSIKRPATVACTVRVVCMGLAVDRAVKNAPGGCV